MSSVRSIKGSVFARVVEEVVRALDRAGLSRSDATKWLEPADLALLDQAISVAGWYDVRA